MQNTFLQLQNLLSLSKCKTLCVCVSLGEHLCVFASMCDCLRVHAGILQVCMCENNKLFFFFLLVYFHCFLLQRWEVLMRVHQPLPPDNKYQSTKPINTVIAGAHRFAGNYALWMFLNPPPQSPNHPALHPAMCCPSSGSPNRRSKATESLRMGAGPIRGRNTQHKRLLLDQPSRVVPGIAFQLS